MMIDLRTVTEESLLKEISSKIDTLLPVVRKYLIYKIFTANKESTCGEVARETENQKKLFDVLTEYTEREKMKQDLFKMLHEEAAKINKENDYDDWFEKRFWWNRRRDLSSSW